MKIHEESFDFNKFIANKAMVEVWGMELPVVSINDLIGMKERKGENVLFLVLDVGDRKDVYR